MAAATITVRALATMRTGRAAPDRRSLRADWTPGPVQSEAGAPTLTDVAPNQPAFDVVVAIRPISLVAAGAGYDNSVIGAAPRLANQRTCYQ
jgi:hypothetical protein